MSDIRERARTWLKGHWSGEPESILVFDLLAALESAPRERDQALAEVEQLRGNQRVEQLEPWLGKCKGSD